MTPKLSYTAPIYQFSIDYKENEEQLLNLYKDFLKFEKYPEKIGSDNFDNLIKDVHQEIAQAF